MEEQGYNGWTNHETWLVNLWLNDCVDSLPEELGTTDTASIAEAIRELVEEIIWGDEVPAADLATDLMISALDAVNWRELAEYVVEEYRSNIEAQGEGDR